MNVIADRIVRKNPFLRDWSNYGIVDIFNPVATAQYQHSVTIPTKPGMLHDFRDLRFFQPDGSEIPFWIESKTDGSTAFVWFKPHSASNRQTYVFYGNREAVSQSNGDKTFEFFDDFLGSALDTTKWTSSGTGTRNIANSICQLTSPSNNFNQYSQTAFGVNTAIRSKFMMEFTTSDYRYSWLGYANAAGGTPLAFFTVGDGVPTFRSRTHNGSTNYDAVVSGGDSNYHIYDIIRNSTTNVLFYVDSTLKNTHTSGVPTGSLNVDIGVYPQVTTPNVQSDWVLVRKYTATEPVCQLNQSGLRNPEYR